MIQIQLEKAHPVAEGPIEHLLACHRRIEQRLDTLLLAGERLEQDPQAALTAIANSLHFMDVSGALHTVDEEESVFPRIRQTASSEERIYLDRLESEHREAGGIYLRLKELSAALLEDVTAERIQEYRALAAMLNAGYRAHIASEDTILVELGRRTLNTAHLESIQSEMHARRR